MCFFSVFLTGGIQVNESIKEREHSKISMRKEFTAQSTTLGEINKNLKSTIHELCFRLRPCSAEICAWPNPLFHVFSVVRLVIFSAVNSQYFVCAFISHFHLTISIGSSQYDNCRYGLEGKQR